MKRIIATAVLALTAALPAVAGAAAPWLGKPVVEMLREIERAGTDIAWSSQLVPDDLLINFEPAAEAPLNALLQVLEPLGLTLKADSGVFLVVLKPGDEPVVAKTPTRAGGDDGSDIEHIVVSASRYEIAREVSPSQFQLDQQSIQTMPDVGEDPIRITHRLPGAAASGASARAHFRGGEQGEVGIILNGQRLFDPFHVRDYQNIFSTVDSRAIEGVEVFTGGFPARFGDRMSGVVLMESIEAEKPRHTEIGVSVFNTSVLMAGNHNDIQWLFSARRGNLDIVLDKKHGEPSYYDIFSQVQFPLGANTVVSANALYADDSVTVILETDPAEREESTSNTRSTQAWVQFDSEWSNRLSSLTAISYTRYDNDRDGFSNDVEKLVATVRDVRDISEFGLRQDWTFQPGDSHLMQWGFSFTDSDASFDYQGSAEYFGLPALWEGQPASVDRNVLVESNGNSYAAYFADRWKLGDDTIIEWGLRWDDQTYTGLSSDSQVSPRFSLLRRLGAKTELRFSWGRYHQSQGIQELQVEDGISEYWPAQRADHLIAGLQHEFSDSLTLRVEAFHKEMDDIRPRFENLYDPLALIPELSADRVRLEPSSAESNGIEFSLSGEQGDWSWWSTYTLSRAVDTIDGHSERRSWDQRHAVQGGALFSGDRWTFAVAASVHTGWPTTDLDLFENGVDPSGETIYVAVPGPRNKLDLRQFRSLDFRVSREYNVKRGHLTAFFEVSNSFNRRNVCCIDWDSTEDAAGNTELESSRDYWLPLLPAIGILWEF